MKVGERKITTISKLDYQGRGIAFIDQKPTFVFNAYINEKVEIEYTKVKSKWAEAKVISYHEKSIDRIKPICPYYGVCGGCDLMHFSYSKQLAFKQHKMEEIMHQFGIETIIRPIYKSEASLAYRNKITLQVKENIGLFQKKSYDLIAINKCFLVSDKLNSLIMLLKEKLPLQGVAQIVLKEGYDQIMIVVDLSNLDNFRNIKASLNAFSNCFVIKNQKKILFSKNGEINRKIGKYWYTVAPDSFFQVNSYQIKNLYDLVIKYGHFSKNDFVLDLYCGTGTIGIYISSYVKKVVGIEKNKMAIVDAKKNQEKNGITNIVFIEGDIHDKIRQIQNNYDVIIVDPPRSGLDENVISYLENHGSSRVIYISCDPMTLGRDLKKLSSSYDIIELTPVDMFPQTYHVECVCVLKRR